MTWNNIITSFNIDGLKVSKEDNTLVCVCKKKEDADMIAKLPRMMKFIEQYHNGESTVEMRVEAAIILDK